MNGPLHQHFKVKLKDLNENSCETQDPVTNR